MRCPNDSPSQYFRTFRMGASMNKHTESLQLADAIDVFDARSEHMPMELYSDISSELRRLYAENERLNNALQSEQNRSERIGTHGPGCHTWGHRHYECLLREYKSLLEALQELRYAATDKAERMADAVIAKATGE